VQHLQSRRALCYNTQVTSQDLDELMYDDYDFDYTYTNDYADLDENYALDLDDDYARDTHDYQDLAYRHYA
jgi:hypothetical protein